MKAPGNIKTHTLTYLKADRIYMQRNDLPSSNLVISAGLHKNHQDYSNRNQLKLKTTQMLGGFDQFQLNTSNFLCPIPNFYPQQKHGSLKWIENTIKIILANF